MAHARTQRPFLRERRGGVSTVFYGISSGPSRELHVEASVREGDDLDAISLVDISSILRTVMSLHLRSVRDDPVGHQTNLVCVVRPVRPASSVSPHRSLLAIRPARLSLSLRLCVDTVRTIGQATGRVLPTVAVSLHSLHR